MKMEVFQSFLLLYSGAASRYDTCTYTVLEHDTNTDSKDTCCTIPASDAGLPTSRASKLAKHAQPLNSQENAINLPGAA